MSIGSNILTISSAVLIFVVLIYIIISIQNRKLIKTVTTLNRGTKSERNLILSLLKIGIPPTSIYHDLYVKKLTGGYAQLDAVVITDKGIIVFEVKDYSGWIFGECNQRFWTQVLAYGREKYRFYNPIMQNSQHIEELRKKININSDIPLHSFVVFYGNSVLKNINYVPERTYLFKPGNLKTMLKIYNENNEIVNYSNLDTIETELRNAVENGNNPNIREEHIRNINNMLNTQ